MLQVSSFSLFDDDWRDDYIQRLKRQISFRWNQISIKKAPSTRPPRLLPEEEKFLVENKNFILFDPEGEELSEEKLQKICFHQSASVHFVIGPAFGFHSEFKKKAERSYRLSKLQFTHRLAQVIVAESLYRAYCREHNHPFVK